MKPSFPLTLAASVIACGGAFIAGRASAPKDGSDIKEASASIPERSSRASSGSDLASSRSVKSLRSHEDTGLGESPAAVAEMKRIMETVDPLARAQAWLDFVNTLDPDQFESVVADFRDSGLTRENMSEYSMLLTAWAKTDPLQALDYAKANTGSPFARNTILATWVTSDPEAAIAWANENHDGDRANPYLVGVIRGLAQYDPTRASELMLTMPYSRERGDALGAIIPHVLSQGDDAAKNWASSIEDERLRDGAIQRVSEQLAKDDPRGTAEWLASSGGDAAKGAIDEVMGIWAREDSSAAIAHFESMASGELRTNALRGLSSHMASENPREAASFLDAHAADADDGTYRQFVWRSFREEPAIAADYISRIENEREQEQMYRRTLEGWMRNDLEGASQWLSSAQLPDSVAKHLESRMREIGERDR
ncbi:hypothetical protein ACFQY0_06935 [Haloferula chungangensis]|uniref:HEAT repeat domain-containing protein n=1 Tax=Haloferula chungangensis TaxID=1048331 RepID=A0ABW2L748_9BACT